MNKIKLKTISATSINTYNNCELNWYLKYVAKLLNLPNPAFIIGSAYHKCIEDFNNGMAKEFVIEKLKKDILKDKPTEEDIKTFGLVRRMFEKYLINAIEGSKDSSEFKFNIKIPGIPVPLFGFIDRVDKDKIVEYKTTSQDFTLNDVKTIQSKIYVYAIYRTLKKILPVEYSINNKKKVNKDNYKPQRLRVEYTKDDLEDLEDDLRAFYNKVVSQTNFKHKQGIYPCQWCHIKSEITI
jgi:RecB family exonuclease